MKIAYYQDLILFSDIEVSLSFLQNKLFNALHLYFVKQKKSDGTVAYAVSFPLYSLKNRNIGNVFRIFSETEEDLVLMYSFVIKGKYEEYIEASDIRLIPSDCHNYVRFSRKQVKSNSDRLIRRTIKRKTLSYEDAKNLYSSFECKLLNLPSIGLHSYSTDQDFRVYIAKEKCIGSKEGLFNSYGLSLTENGVPCF